MATGHDGFLRPLTMLDLSNTDNDSMRPLVHLSLTVSEELLPRFCLLAGGGLTICARTGGSVEDLLCGELNIAPEYVESRIQTIFLNNRAVDDPRLAIVTPGSTIALSAAMPGIAGAMVRKGSPYAPMRSRISHAGRPDAEPKASEGQVVVKLFNLLQTELGPALLARGAQISGKALSDLFDGRSETFRCGILAARIDDRSASADAIFATDWADRDVFLRVTCRG